MKGTMHSILSAIGIYLLCSALPLHALLLIPMDDIQTDHLKAYGIVYKMLKEGVRVYWLLNYRGGSFAAEVTNNVFDIRCRTAGVIAKPIGSTEWAAIVETIKN